MISSRVLRFQVLVTHRHALSSVASLLSKLNDKLPSHVMSPLSSLDITESPFSHSLPSSMAGMLDEPIMQMIPTAELPVVTLNEVIAVDPITRGVLNIYQPLMCDRAFLF
jgi:hypothetical protein